MNKLLCATIALVTYASADCAYKAETGLEDLDATKLTTGVSNLANVNTVTLPGYWLMTHSTYEREDRTGCVDLHLGPATVVAGDTTTKVMEGAQYSKDLWSWFLPTVYSG